MNYLKSIIVVTLCIFTVFSCSKKQSEKSSSDPMYSVDAKTTTIGWTAYKTSDKVPVKGKFTQLNIVNSKPGKTVLEALNGVEFSIPVSSIFTSDTSRDKKIIDHFFGTLANTSNITGSINTNNANSGTLSLMLNGINQNVPINYTIDGQMVSFSGVLNLDNWKTQTAIAALNTICKELHKGADGVSKTWSEVEISANAYLKFN